MSLHRPRVVIDARWMQRANAAFTAAVAQNGAPTKVMACWLQEHGFWDQALSVDSLVAKFNNALRAAKGERFRAIEILALTAQFGGVELLEFYSQSMGYSLARIPDAEFEARAAAETVATPQRVLFAREDENPL